MVPRNRRRRTQAKCTLALFAVIGIAWAARVVAAQAAGSAEQALHESFDRQVNPFLARNCVVCHNADLPTSGVGLDQLDASLSDRQLRLWEVVQKRIVDGTMPPKTMPQPSGADRQQMVKWITEALDVARSRPTPKNGIVRRLTVSQYRNTLRELLRLGDDLTDALPPDAVSKDGFVNNVETLQMSPLLMEAYFEIAEEAFTRSIVDPDSKPSIQNFRLDLGAGVNPDPLTEKLILGAGSELLETSDYMVTQLTPSKPFAFEPFQMRTKFRFIEGYEGNDTVRGWRDFDSIYHAVFADFRGSAGYPKGEAYSTVPEGLLLRPAIPTTELFGIDSTYGPHANFKISLRELPDHGRFRVTVTAAKYNDGLMLDPGEAAQPVDAPGALSTSGDPGTAQTIEIKKAGVYQMDVHEVEQKISSAPDASKLSEDVAGAWAFDTDAGLKIEGEAQLVDSPFGKALSLDGEDDSVLVPHEDQMDVGEGDFTVSAWIHPTELRGAGIVVAGSFDQMPGWRLSMFRGRGALEFATVGQDRQPNGTVTSPPGVIQAHAWQHVAAVVRREKKQVWLYVNGYPVAVGEMGAANLDNPADLRIGRVSYTNFFRGQIDDVRVYKRALDEAELQALLQPGRSLTLPPPVLPQDVVLTMGDREFSGSLEQPAFLAVRLEAGPLRIQAEHSGLKDLNRVVLTPIADDSELARRVNAFAKRSPQLGVLMGLRRDCGSTLVPVGEPQAVSSEQLSRFVFEGSISDYPSPDVEKDNVNYLAGIREIGVRSEYTDGRDMPRLVIRSVEFEGPFYETWPPATHTSIFGEFERKSDTAAYAREIIRNFATRAYRRPATDAEQAALVAVFDRSLAQGRSFRDSIKEALLVALSSPQFLFLVEASSSPLPEPLNDYELASKLSYFLWNGPPDQTTLQLAAAGTLRQHLDSEVQRMIADPRFARFTNEFVPQWLNLEKFDVVEVDRQKYPKLNRAVRSQLRQEPTELLQYLIRENLPARNLIASDFVLENEVTADYYGLTGKTDSGFEFVPVVHGQPELGGLLTQAAFMAGLSDGRESNPVKRGAWVARKIIAEPPDDPPPNVPNLKADTEGLTLRQRLEQHRSVPGCMQCHLKIDPWGVALEELDAGGRLKREPADASSTLPDGSQVSGVNELKRYLSQDRFDQVAFSVLKHLATYANGRTLTYNEINSLKQDGLTLRADGYRMQDMIRFVVHSETFLEK
jgi:mono/diheme cytochrome c family protein